MARPNYESGDKVYELKQNSRYFDIADLPKQALLPISGYQYRELLPLKLALKSVEDLSNIDSQIQTAEENCQHPSDGLTPDEAAAIHIYTMEWISDKGCVYYLLNQKLRLENRHLLKPWFYYLKLILTGLYKLKPFRGTVWRGVKRDLSQEYPTDKIFIWWGFSSCTESLDVLRSEEFIGTTGPRTLFNIQCENGKDIRHHSYLKNEKEILLLPGTKFRVTGNIKIASDAHIIHLQEIIPESPLLADPSDTSKPELLVNEDVTSVSLPPDFNNLMINVDSCDAQRVRNYVNDTIRKRRTSRSIEIIGQQLGDQDMELIANELKWNDNWSILNLESISITDNGVNCLCTGLNRNRIVTALYVYDCPISDHGIQSITQTLQKHRTLTELKLAKSDITDNSCEALSEMLKKNKVLERLLLSENKITDNGIRYILHALTNANDTLKELDLRENQLTDKCIDGIIEMLKKNGTLIKLNLQNNLISKDGKYRIQEVAQRNKVLT